jgi:hypothetical protein
MCREQKTAEAGWPLEGKVEPEVPEGARSIKTPETAERDRPKTNERMCGNFWNHTAGR